MSDALKKRRSFMFFAKKQMSVNIPLQDEAAVEPMAYGNSPKSPAPVMSRAKNSSFFQQGPTQKRGSLGAIEDLVQCPLCLEKLNNPKMLPCQHTFCMQCLKVHLNGKELHCPACQTKYSAGPGFLESLPSNLYIDNLLKLLVAPSNPRLDRAMSFSPPNSLNMTQKRCCKCQSMMDLLNQNCCDHCKQVFCGVCWSAHITELKTQIGSLVRQLESGSKRLNLRLTDYKDRYEWLVNQINSTSAKKIDDILMEKENLLKEAENILQGGEMSADALQKQLKSTQDDVNNYVSKSFDTITDDNEKVSTFMNFHRMAVEILNDVSHWGEAKFSFDQENFKIEEDLDTPNDAEADEPVAVEVRGIQNPLENADNLTSYYRSRQFYPRLVWRKCQRPAGVAVAPWAGQDNLYICTTDSHQIFVLDKTRGKMIQRIMDARILCPHSIAFSLLREEIYVTDKWNHCVHVLSREGEYLRSIGVKGNKEGAFRSPEGISVDATENFIYVCDTGNDRVQVFNIDSGAFVRYIGIVNRNQNSSSVRYTQLNAPTGIAVLPDKIIIMDSGNRKIKIYSLEGEKIHEFGSVGSHKGQFRHPEVVAVDPMGFILVGDSGNARIQIFKPNGQLVRVFGGKGRDVGQFGWISGLHITPQLEIIVSDPRNHQVCIL